MQIAKRIFLFVLVNILVMVSITLIMNILGVQPYLTNQGINLQSLAIFCLLWGFGGAFISLMLSKVMAKMMMSVKVIDPVKATGQERWLVDRIHAMAKQAKLPKMPEVGIYNSPEVNAFATGPSKSNSLVAVSTGLLERMDQDQVEGVLGHEVAHIANGDMVTMTLIQGVVNAFVMFFARILAFVISQQVEESKRPMVQLFATLAFEFALMFLGMLVVAFYSRAREFRADKGGAKLAGKDKMTAALKGLQNMHQLTDNSHASMNAMKISTGRSGGFAALFSTHPPLPLRIRALERANF
jgi:heat shock protein HtpX